MLNPKELLKARHRPPDPDVQALIDAGKVTVKRCPTMTADGALDCARSHRFGHHKNLRFLAAPGAVQKPEKSATRLRRRSRFAQARAR